MSKSILHIDDDADDREMLELAFQKIQPDVQFHAAPNGMEGLVFLQNAKAAGELPCLVVLDINMPVLDGRRTLDKIRHDPDLNTLPVVIFTSSQNPNDAHFFNSRATAFLTKPVSFDGLSSIAKKLISYCL